MTTAPTAPDHGVLVGAVGVSRAERTADALARLEERLGLGPGALRLERACPTCGSAEHGAPSLAWAPAQERPDVGPGPGGVLTGAWRRLRRRGPDCRPALPAVSLSHTAGEHPVTVLAWCAPMDVAVDAAAGGAAGTEAGPVTGAPVRVSRWSVGVDVEDVDSARTRRALEPGEDGAAAADAVAFSAGQLATWSTLPRRQAYAARVDAWCRAEALVKARGTGFTEDPSAVRPHPGERVLRLTPEEAPGLPVSVRGVLVLSPRTR